MEDLLNQIESGVNDNLYYLALLASLSIPDICGALDSKNGKAERNKYIGWYNENVGNPKQYYLTGEDCYYFRCSMIHQGKTSHKNSQFKRILFIEPSANNKKIFHNNILHDALNIDIREFCYDLTVAARDWFKLKSEGNFIQKNYQDFVKRYPNGLSPYITGLSVIS